MRGYVSALAVGRFQGACKFFLAFASFASTYVMGILHMIKIQVTVIRFNYHNSSDQFVVKVQLEYSIKLL